MNQRNISVYFRMEDLIVKKFPEIGEMTSPISKPIKETSDLLQLFII